MNVLKQEYGEFIWYLHNISIGETQLCSSGIKTDTTGFEPENLNQGEKILLAEQTTHLLNNNCALTTVH